MVVKIANKYFSNLKGFQQAFGFGECVLHPQTQYKAEWWSWQIEHFEHVKIFASYMQKHRSFSIKHKRLDLVETFYQYVA